LVCNLAARKPSPHPKGAGAEELSRHPVEIGHDEIEVRFAPVSRRLGVDPDVHPGVYFQHILEIPLQQSACSAKQQKWLRTAASPVSAGYRHSPSTP
jgi:hypothetical protein